MRICEKCDTPVWFGFIIFEDDYYCSETCLHKDFTPEEYLQLYAEEEAYWTEWETQPCMVCGEETKPDKVHTYVDDKETVYCCQGCLPSPDEYIKPYTIGGE